MKPFIYFGEDPKTCKLCDKTLSKSFNYAELKIPETISSLDRGTNKIDFKYKTSWACICDKCTKKSKVIQLYKFTRNKKGEFISP